MLLLISLPSAVCCFPRISDTSKATIERIPWKDVRVREAMSIAIDRVAIAKKLYQGLAVPAPIGLMIPGWDKLKPIPYDPNRAKQLLAAAGYPNGFTFKLLTHDKEPTLPVLAEAVAGYWNAVGLRGEIVPGDYAKMAGHDQRPVRLQGGFGLIRSGISRTGRSVS